MAAKKSSKLNKWFIISIVLYLILCGGVILFSFMYVETKRDRLLSQAHSELSNFFDTQDKYVSVAYSGEKVAYEKGKLPKYETPLWLNKYEWDEVYGNLYKIYHLKPRWKSESEFDRDGQWSGWLFNIIEQRGYDYIELYQAYPIAVGYLKQPEYYYSPSVQTAINDVFELYTTSERSSYYGKFSDVSVWSIQDKVENEYYMMWSYDFVKNIHGKDYADSIASYGPWYLNDGGNVPCTETFDFLEVGDKLGYWGSHNARVYIGRAHREFWHIVYRVWEDPQAKDRNRILLLGLIPLTTIFLVAIVLLSIKRKRIRAIENENLKQKLLRLCQPSNFMNPYNKELVDNANALYPQITQCESQEELISLADKAQKLLYIQLIEQSELDEYIKLVNPSNYMKPYNAEKIALANELYAILQNKTISYSDFISVKNRAKHLSE